MSSSQTPTALPARIKGTSITSFLGFLEAEYGASATRSFLASLSPDLRRRCDGLILASAFYSLAELESLSLKARSHFNPDPSFFERSGAHNASVGLSGVHQALLARRSPLDFLRAAERGWAQFVDRGSVFVDLVDDGQVRVRIEGLPGSEVFCARETGFLSRSLELAGARSLRVAKGRCTRKRDACCDWSLAWDASLSPQSQSHTQTSAIRRPTAV